MDESQALSASQAYSIASLRTLVRSGRIRIPQFQRAFRWERRDVISLVDSLLRGFPIGSLLLWKRGAPRQRLTIGALRVEAPEVADALWVVDGQQRITSLVNVVDPVSGVDPRFAIGYSLKDREVVPLRPNSPALVIPLPDLFDFSRALAWLQDNPDAREHSAHIQAVAGRLNTATVPATVIEDADEKILREVFDRINNRGKPLSSAEIFDAIHARPDTGLTTSLVAAHLDDATSFGVLSDKIIVQAILVRRHPDISREAKEIQTEFSRSWRMVTDFPEESQQEALESTQSALIAAVRFLQERCGIPHMVLLPFRFQLLVLTRFFALFPVAKPRNLELLSRWLWRTSAGADRLGISGSQTDLRAMATCLVAGEESASVQRLLARAELPDGARIPDLSVFRATRSDSKLILAAQWNRQPADVLTGRPITVEQLREHLDGETTPSAVVADLAPATEMEDGAPVAAAKMLALVDQREVMARLPDLDDGTLGSLLLNRQVVALLQANRFTEAVETRAWMLETHLEDFLAARAAWDQEDTPPLTDYIADDQDGA
ncbi:MAG: DUF262 domain-containing protein [Actinomyces sp.]|uniref:GmrSD restriction endonuclease domain-containing protein n=1 Tax=Actinomyces sp. TaxID=29317 RepID=UPI0026DA91D0|nr:DUF262 domain-containing protein [Actinomyces sp.]MDO4243637.1 DUF262 domain-containing protein [Actinomyces sp.]